MAVGTRLGNGHIVLLLTPREATILSDELLQPEDFPWQNTESQMTSAEVRSVLRGLVAQDAQDRLRQAAGAIEEILRNPKFQDEEEPPV